MTITLESALKDNIKHIIYWTRRLGAPASQYEDCLSVGRIQIIKDFNSLTPVEFHSKISYRIASAVGTYLAKDQGYSSLQNGTDHNWVRRPVSYDMLITESADINFVESISFKHWLDNRYEDRFDIIYNLVKPYLTKTDIQLVDELYTVYSTDKSNGYKYTPNKLCRRMHRNPSHLERIAKLGKLAGYTKSKNNHKILEEVRARIENKVCMILKEHNFADVEQTKNPTNRLRPYNKITLKKGIL